MSSSLNNLRSVLLRGKSLHQYYDTLSPEQFEPHLQKWYFKKTKNNHNIIDFRNPKTFDEKMQWIKLYDATELKTRYADKYLAKDMVAEKIGAEYIAPTLGVWDSFEDIDFNALPERFALKANHGSGWNLIVRDKGKLNISEARKSFNKWLKCNYAYDNGFELHYKGITPKIIAEEYYENESGVLYDYRVFCFHGRPLFIVLSSIDPAASTKCTFYDENLKHIPGVFDAPELPNPPFDRPLLTKLMDLSRILAENFLFVRVDFHVVHGKIYFAEMTFTPATGVLPWKDQKFNRYYGGMLKLPFEASPAIPAADPPR